MREREIRIETRYDDDGPVYSTSIMCLGFVAWHGIFFCVWTMWSIAPLPSEIIICIIVDDTR